MLSSVLCFPASSTTMTLPASTLAVRRSVISGTSWEPSPWTAKSPWRYHSVCDFIIAYRSVMCVWYQGIWSDNVTYMVDIARSWCISNCCIQWLYPHCNTDCPKSSKQDGMFEICFSILSEPLLLWPWEPNCNFTNTYFYKQTRKLRIHLHQFDNKCEAFRKCTAI